MSYDVLSWLTPGLLLVLVLVSQGRADEKLTWDDPPFQAFSENLGGVIGKYYPDARLERPKASSKSLEWSYKTRKFMVHLPTLTGQWQEASEMLGPDRKGILCTAEIHEGPYVGMAVVPQTFDRHYFKVLMMAPNRKDVGAHLIVRLFYPSDIDKAVVSEIAELVQQFDSER
ncbi:hypothetical protein C5Y96_06830 [Blastopirellula marina]|uniref:Uncharacterized protein n=1 Tax=Blastopirellula marina TaxID=124 RepID=A0A2S8FYF2_9BACT|nr:MULTISPECIES: hypothetical protein [Pirellulaceae]PQO36874.1 hypothetical protein C5Y96_06830 [Blastopirellula marina]RCS53589.1 hypothetical protein DTL36_06840 [Bremerella cremea]